MNFMRIAFFVDSLQEHSTVLKDKIASEFTCFESSNPDEFDQAYRQSGPVALIFSDPQYGVHFLQSNADALKEIKYKAYGYIKEDKKYTAKSQEILKAFKLNVFKKSELELILTDVRNFFSNKVSEAASDDILFKLPED